MMMSGLIYYFLLDDNGGRQHGMDEIFLLLGSINKNEPCEKPWSLNVVPFF
jgi:hypothetical protein